MRLRQRLLLELVEEGEILSEDRPKVFLADHSGDARPGVSETDLEAGTSTVATTNERQNNLP